MSAALRGGRNGHRVFVVTDREEGGSNYVDRMPPMETGTDTG